MGENMDGEGRGGWCSCVVVALGCDSVRSGKEKRYLLLEERCSFACVHV